MLIPIHPRSPSPAPRPSEKSPPTPRTPADQSRTQRRLSTGIGKRPVVGGHASRARASSWRSLRHRTISPSGGALGLLRRRLWPFSSTPPPPPPRAETFLSPRASSLCVASCPWWRPSRRALWRHPARRQLWLQAQRVRIVCRHNAPASSAGAMNPRAVYQPAIRTLLESCSRARGGFSSTELLASGGAPHPQQGCDPPFPNPIPICVYDPMTNGHSVSTARTPD
ncbi:hypothetical protein C8J57DRAFT_1573245 [Mycena rebaudengoi]|nr:hypothetical protein C8J57DRAFT_1573245 [Mycena rebaudengoi]